MKSEWTKEQEKILLALHRKGETAAQIANALGDVFSHSAVLGKLNRLGLNGHRPSPPPNITKIARAPSPPILPGSFEPSPVRFVSAPLPGCKPVSLFDLTNETCRWPLDGHGPIAFFCGHRSADLCNGEPYCSTHAARAFTERRGNVNG